MGKTPFQQMMGDITLETEADRLRRVQARAQAVLARGPLVLDVETTGLGMEDEVIEIGIVDAWGKIIFESLVHPKQSIPRDATRVHGLTDEDVQHAPRWPEIHDRVCSVLTGRVIIAYNAEFDERMLRQTAGIWGLEIPTLETWCAMLAYAEYFGDWDGYYCDYRWRRLGDAAWQLKVPRPDGVGHRAVHDCLLCLGVVKAMAA